MVFWRPSYSLASLVLASPFFGKLPLHSLLMMCPTLEKLELSQRIVEDNYSEADLYALPKFHPLHKLILWYLEPSEWGSTIQFFIRFMNISGSTITSFRMGHMGLCGGTPFTETIPWLRRLSENLQILDVWETLFFQLVESYSHKILNRSPPDADEELRGFELKGFPRLESFRSTVSLSQPESRGNTRIEVAAFFMDWLAHQVSSLPVFHPLKKIGLDVTIHKTCPWRGSLDGWDGESPPMPTTWPAMDVAFSQREPPIYTEYSLYHLMRGNDEMIAFIQGALHSLHERQLLKFVISYDGF
ncbi:hypothetical protein DL96DRAFT_1687468 [Flagelloscypha sp. PMI_526]|nr:hypothetical protein DL96DRAFT_1687468 [Flagelloscypha sp. PMI_526]